MTCHWIGQDLRRQHGTLACKEIKEKQTNVVLAQAIFDVHHEFGLGNKVVATTTDNGANYVAAFKYFGVGNMPVEEEEEQDPEVVVGQPANLHAQLEEVAPAVVKLPKHYRCGWNSYYDAVQSLMDVLSNPDKMRALNEILSKGGVATFDERDKHILSEYLKVMQPVAECLDSLQSEANAYMGTFMPNLQLMRVQLETLKVDRQALVTALLGKEGSGKGFYGRFADQLKDADFLMATALHPHYTISLVRHFSPDQAADIKDRIVREVKDIVGTKEEEQPEERKERMDKFHLLLSSTQSLRLRRQEEVEETIVKTLEDWKRKMVDIPSVPTCSPPPTGMPGWTFSRGTTPLSPALLPWKGCSAPRET
ncbi:hypothetical protein GWK47_046180 [Chionoecetes opilio]|uniref:Uncharacterized protein n=1 Tax=Chionoecetes opilio TaxID=41210 RepID=A0A8J5CH65_CHIOP|nr:hypothetical protein GWK47_046180 [Chionoecetes opilio]KAG0721595.1 hypothetical protein GWK47_046180 [Chionoecetes opilio]